VRIFAVEDGPEVMKLEGGFKGMPVLVRRNHMGHWCGYVGVPLDHPWAKEGRDYPPVDVHGGCTFASRQHPFTREEGAFWIGFDCAHSFDAPPPWATKIDGMETGFGGAVYRTLRYVEREIMGLVDQAKVAE